jgi:hypothetical protein
VSEPAVVVVSRHWHDRRAELAFVTRSIAGAASRSGPVTVLVPGEQGEEVADGAFELRGLGPADAPQWPVGLPTRVPVIVDELTPEISTLLGRTRPTSVSYVSGTDGASRPGWRPLGPSDGEGPIAVHVPVNRLAELHRHHGFGSIDYVLVLSDRAGTHAAPPPAAAWVSAGFNDADVIVVENAVASAWKGRALRGNASVDTRMDLWRLVAHARVCVDLAPGPFIARECIEALRFGTPIIVPERSGAAEMHARATGGSTFGDPGELLTAVGDMQNTSNRSVASRVGRDYADDRYGSPTALVAQMKGLLQPE